MADWDNCYYTFDKKYEAKQLNIFHQMYNKVYLIFAKGGFETYKKAISFGDLNGAISPFRIIFIGIINQYIGLLQQSKYLSFCPCTEFESREEGSWF